MIHNYLSHYDLYAMLAAVCVVAWARVARDVLAARRDRQCGQPEQPEGED